MSRRVLRHWRAALSSLCLLMGAAVASLAACSHFAFAPIGQYWTTSWYPNGGYHNRGWLARDGSLHLIRDDRTIEPSLPSGSSHRRRDGIDPAPGFHLEPTKFGFANVNRISGWREPGGGGVRQVTNTRSQWSFPLWLPALVLALPAVGRVASRLRRRNRRLTGRCISCGYDLTGNLSGTCPECGGPAPVVG